MDEKQLHLCFYSVREDTKLCSRLKLIFMLSILFTVSLIDVFSLLGLNSFMLLNTNSGSLLSIFMALIAPLSYGVQCRNRSFWARMHIV